MMLKSTFVLFKPKVCKTDPFQRDSRVLGIKGISSKIVLVQMIGDGQLKGALQSADEPGGMMLDSSSSLLNVHFLLGNPSRF
jgi:hypothetical protein